MERPLGHKTCDPANVLPQAMRVGVEFTQSIGADMSVAPVPSRRKRAISRRAIVRLKRPSPGEGLHRVEVVAPDPECAALLLECASPLFPAAIAPGTPSTVRLQPPTSGARWVIDLLAVVERWLEAVPLPCAKLSYGGRSYLIRSARHLEDPVVSSALSSRNRSQQ